ncbi:MAG: carboxymuconolactone decarboxylase family protein [Nitrospinae bacterium]|nr:carboxymuconolactone decarboxylase family protein [Nitrospinota bacterium]
MGLFKQHSDSTAPQGSAEVLAKVKDRYGFIPNLAAFVAESPLALDAIMNLSGFFDRSSLTPQEQQIVLLTVATLNGCDYCKTAHTGLGRMAGLEAGTLKAVAGFEPLADAKLSALRDFTRALVEDRGWVGDEKVSKFLNAGYTKAQVFEVVMGVALKTFTNYCNHLAGARPNPEFVAMANS